MFVIQYQISKKIKYIVSLCSKNNIISYVLLTLYTYVLCTLFIIKKLEYL